MDNQTSLIRQLLVDHSPLVDDVIDLVCLWVREIQCYTRDDMDRIPEGKTHVVMLNMKIASNPPMDLAYMGEVDVVRTRRIFTPSGYRIYEYNIQFTMSKTQHEFIQGRLFYGIDGVPYLSFAMSTISWNEITLLPCERDFAQYVLTG